MRPKLRGRGGVDREGEDLDGEEREGDCLGEERLLGGGEKWTEMGLLRAPPPGPPDSSSSRMLES